MTLNEAIEEVKRMMDRGLDVKDMAFLGLPRDAIATILNAVVKGELTCK